VTGGNRVAFCSPSRLAQISTEPIVYPVTLAHEVAVAGKLSINQHFRPSFRTHELANISGQGPGNTWLFFLSSRWLRGFVE